MSLSNVLKIGMSNTKYFQHIINVPFLFKDWGLHLKFNVGEEMILVKVTLYLLMSVSLKIFYFKKKYTWVLCISIVFTTHLHIEKGVHF